MIRLSISTAWEESQAIIARDGKLFVSVALALVALPTAVSGLINPSGVADTGSALPIDVIVLAVSLIALAGQLALIRLALGPSIAVGSAIGHGIRRMPIYFLAVLLIALAVVVAAIPFVLAMVAMGVPLDQANPSIPATPGTVIAFLLFFALFCFIAVRMVMAAPVASAEAGGPIHVLKRSWGLTSGNWWRLFAFLVAFFVGALVVLIAIGAVLSLFVTAAFGPIAPMSASALVVALVQALANAAITTLLAVMLARIYAQLSGRGEAQASVPTSGT